MFFLLLSLVGLLLLFRYYRHIRIILISFYNRVLSKILPVTFHIEHHHKYMIITYIENGISEKLYIPVDINQAFNASQSEVYACYADREVLIKQNDSVPLMITANMVSAKGIRVYNILTDTERYYQGDELPDYR